VDKTVDYLKNIHHIIEDIIGTTNTGKRYSTALEDAIRRLSSDEVSLITDDFAVSVIKQKRGIIVDVFLISTGDLVETWDLTLDDILSDEAQIGES